MKKILVICALFLLAQLSAVHYSSSNMTVEEKVGQLLMVHFRGSVANETSERLIKELHVGGFIYYTWSNGLHSPEQVKMLSTQLQASAKTPLFIAVDQEGGRISRLVKGFEIFPSSRDLVKIGTVEIAKENAYRSGIEIGNVGINMNLAPVVDVDSNSLNPVIGDRSYSSKPEVVVQFAEAALLGYKKAGIIPVMKHFPGHGDTSLDSHFELPVVNKSLKELEKTELYPYKELIFLADVIMTGHILVPALDSLDCATFSSFVLTDFLRYHLGFNGVIISDSLVMAAAIDSCGSVEEAAIKALNAGCDILLIGGRQLQKAQDSFELTVDDVVKVHDKLVQAVKLGIVSESRLNEAVERVLSLKSQKL